MADVPVTPDNPFAGGGAEKNIDVQKALLNNLIANQGQGGRALYERQAPEAQAMLNDRLNSAGTVPAARQAVYDAFTRDARAAEQQQANTIARQGQIGNLFMDQAKAAVPIYSKNVDLASQAMRQQYEERMAAQAASRASSSAGSVDKNSETYWRSQDPNGASKANPYTEGQGWSNVGRPVSETPQQAEAAGTAQPQKSFDDAAKSLKLPPWQALKKLDPGLEPDANQLQGAINAAARKTGKDAFTFDDLVSELNNWAATDDSLQSSAGNRRALVDVLLAANAGRWGVADPTKWGYDDTAHATLRANYGRSMGRNILAGPGQTGVAGG